MSANSGETTILRPPAYVPGGRSVAAERGWAWIAAGWTLVMRAPLPWILITILSIVILIGLSLFKVIGTMVHIFLTPVLLGGLALGCRSL